MGSSFDDDPLHVRPPNDKFSHGAPLPAAAAEQSHDSPAAQHPVGPYGPAPFQNGYHFFYPSQRSEPGTPYIKDDYAYRCRGAIDNGAAGFAALAATQSLTDERRKAKQPPPSPTDPELLKRINEFVAEVCHPKEGAATSPFMEDLGVRQGEGGSPYSRGTPPFFDKKRK